MRQNQRYVDANASRPVQYSRSGRPVVQPYALSYDINASQLDSQLAQSQRQFLEAQYPHLYPPPQQVEFSQQGYGLPQPQPMPQNQQYEQAYAQPQQFPSIRQGPAMAPQGYAPQGFVQQGYVPVRRAREVDPGRRIAPRTEGVPPAHMAWAADNGIGQVINSEYRALRGQQQFLQQQQQQQRQLFAPQSAQPRVFHQAFEQQSDRVYSALSPEQRAQREQQLLQQHVQARSDVQQQQPQYQQQFPPPGQQQFSPPSQRVRSDVQDDGFSGGWWGGETYGPQFGPDGTQLETQREYAPEDEFTQQGYAPEPVPQGYAPAHSPQGFAPAQGYAPAPAPHPAQLEQHRQQSFVRRPAGHVQQGYVEEILGDDGFPDQDQPQGRVRKVRLCPPYPENVSASLYAHTVQDEWEAYQFTKNHVQKTLVSSVWGDGSIWGGHTEALVNFERAPSQGAQGKHAVYTIVQKLESKCDSALRMLQRSSKSLQPSIGLVALPSGIYDQCHPLHHYMAGVFQVKNASPGANKLGYVFALMCSLPSEWEGLKTGTQWVTMAKFSSPLGEDDPFLWYDGTEGSIYNPSAHVARPVQTHVPVISQRTVVDTTPPKQKGGQQGAQKGPSPAKAEKERLSPEKIARTAAQKARVPSDAIKKNRCINCGEAGHRGYQCEQECLQCEDNHLGATCPKNLEKGKKLSDF